MQIQFRRFFKFSPQECFQTLKQGMPVIGSELIFALSPFIGTIFAAKMGYLALAAQGLVSILFLILCVFIWGFLSSVGVLVGRHHGAEEHKEAVHVLQHGLILAGLISIPLVLILANASWLFSVLHQDPRVVALTVPYLKAYCPAIVGLAFYATFAEYLIGTNHSKIIFCISAIETFFNILMQYVLAFGKFGFPHLGVSGLAWGLSIVIWLSNILLLIYIFIHTRQHWKNLVLKLAYLKELIYLGSPSGAMYVIEVGFYLVVSLMMGKISSESLAADQVATQFVAFFITIVWGLGQATTARVSQAIGAKNQRKAIDASVAGIQIGVIMMTVTAIFFWLIPKQIIGIDLHSHQIHPESVFYLAENFLKIAGFYIIFDGCRVVLLNALRAYKDTYYPMYVSVIAFWFIALISGYILAFRFGLEGYGLWWGMILGIACAAGLLMHRLLKHFKASLNV